MVVDASSCTLGLTVEAVEALPDALRERHASSRSSTRWNGSSGCCPAPERRSLGRVAVHPTCAIRHLGLTRRFEALARDGLRGRGGARRRDLLRVRGRPGMLHPELTASATADEAHELAARGPFDAHLSTNRTCEIGLERATGEAFGSIVLALEELTR